MSTLKGPLIRLIFTVAHVKPQSVNSNLPLASNEEQEPVDSRNYGFRA